MLIIGFTVGAVLLIVAWCVDMRLRRAAHAEREYRRLRNNGGL